MKNFLCLLRRLSPNVDFIVLGPTPQKQRVQTHSRGRAKRSSHDENFTTFLLLELFSFLFHLHNVNSEKEESCQGKRLSE